jgi:hypothetical protein
MTYQYYKWCPKQPYGVCCTRLKHKQFVCGLYGNFFYLSDGLPCLIRCLVSMFSEHVYTLQRSRNQALLEKSKMKKYLGSTSSWNTWCPRSRRAWQMVCSAIHNSWTKWWAAKDQRVSEPFVYWLDDESTARTTKLLRRRGISSCASVVSVFGVLSQDTRAAVSASAAPIAFVESAAPLFSAWILQGQWRSRASSLTGGLPQFERFICLQWRN